MPVSMRVGEIRIRKPHLKPKAVNALRVQTCGAEQCGGRSCNASAAVRSSPAARRLLHASGGNMTASSASPRIQSALTATAGEPMNGAESLVRTLAQAGVSVCFANPGTSEMHFVAALDKVAGIRCVLCLFEGVATGAADGYARMAEKPAATLLHLGPGLANGLANLHNAKKARTPMVNIVGDHATYHLELDAPLTADIEAAAAPFSHWVQTGKGAET